MTTGTTYEVKFTGLSAETLGDLLALVNENNRKYGRAKITDPEIEVRKADRFDVVLAAAGANKIQVIKAIREITGLGLKEAKDLVESVPKLVLKQVTRTEAAKALGALREAGATADLT